MARNQVCAQVAPVTSSHKSSAGGSLGREQVRWFCYSRWNLLIVGVLAGEGAFLEVGGLKWWAPWGGFLTGEWGDTLRCLQTLKGRTGGSGAPAALLQPCTAGFWGGHPAEPPRGDMAQGRGWFNDGALWDLPSEKFPLSSTWSLCRW